MRYDIKGNPFGVAVCELASGEAMKSESGSMVWMSPNMKMSTNAGGGIGNAIDRVVAGKVTDFFATTFMDFAVFNVADIFITCGVVVAFVLWTRWDRAREAAETAGA